MPITITENITTDQLRRTDSNSPHKRGFATRKRERVRVTSHLGAQFRYTSRSRTLLGFASRRDVSTENKDIDTSKWHDNSPLNALVNKN